MPIYLDNNSTTPIAPRVASKVFDVMLGVCGNPSSPHFAGDASRAIVDDARSAVRDLAGLPTHTVVFTGSGSEANTLVLSSLLRRLSAEQHVFCSAIEHSSVLRSLEMHCRRAMVRPIPLNIDGSVNLSEFRSAIGISKPALVSLQWVNNETGVVQPMREVAELCADNHIVLHCDAAQAFGKLSLNLVEGISFLTGTGHKFHGPQGCGFIVAHPTSPEITPIIGGGEQERGVRPGTENVAGLAGLAEAARLRLETIDADIKAMKSLRDFFDRLVLEHIPRARINFMTSERVCNTSSVTFVGCDGQAIMHRLSEESIACSQSSACESSSPRPSHVLKALAFSDEEAFATLRFSVSPFNTSSEIEECVRTLDRIVRQQLRFFSIGPGKLFEPLNGAKE